MAPVDDSLVVAELRHADSSHPAQRRHHRALERAPLVVSDSDPMQLHYLLVLLESTDQLTLQGRLQVP